MYTYIYIYQYIYIYKIYVYIYIYIYYIYIYVCIYIYIYIYIYISVYISYQLTNLGDIHFREEGIFLALFTSTPMNLVYTNCLASITLFPS